MRLTEVEAYDGASDPASHAYPRAYAAQCGDVRAAGPPLIYFSYGMHWAANIICGPDGVASGRAAAGRRGDRRRRAGAVPARRAIDRDLARGPGRLSQALGLSAEHKGCDLLGGGPVRLEPGGRRR